jgi:CheY-like chemotaxis protein
MPKKKILLLDDDPEFTDLDGASLTKLGYDVKVVNDGTKAAEKARAFQPDVVLLDLDWRPQEVTYGEILGKLRALKEVKANSIVAYTSTVSLNTIEQMGRRVEDELPVINKDEVDTKGLVDRLRNMKLL